MKKFKKILDIFCCVGFGLNAIYCIYIGNIWPSIGWFFAFAYLLLNQVLSKAYNELFQEYKRLGDHVIKKIDEMVATIKNNN